MTERMASDIKAKLGCLPIIAMAVVFWTIFIAGLIWAGLIY